MHDPADDELLTDPALREEFGIGNEDTTRRWRERGYGPPYIRLGPAKNGSVRYRRGDVKRWLASRTFGSIAEETSQTAA